MDAQVYGIWTQTVAELMSYRYLGCRSVLGAGFEARGEMALRSDMRHEGSLLAAPVAIAMLDTAGIAVDRHWQLALTAYRHPPVRGRVGSCEIGRTRLDDPPGPQSGVHRGDVRRRRPTRCRARVRHRGLGGDRFHPFGFRLHRPRAGVEDTGNLPALASAYDAHPRAGGGLVIAELTPRLGGFVLHHGPILVSLEAAALEVAGARCACGSAERANREGGQAGPVQCHGAGAFRGCRRLVGACRSASGRRRYEPHRHRYRPARQVSLMVDGGITGSVEGPGIRGGCPAHA